MSSSRPEPEVIHYDKQGWEGWRHAGTSKELREYRIESRYRQDPNTPEIILASVDSPWPYFIPQGKWRRTPAILSDSYEKDGARYVVNLKTPRKVSLFAIRTTDLFTYDGEGETTWVLIRPGFVLEKYNSWRDLIESLGLANIDFITEMVPSSVYAMGTNAEPVEQE